MNEFIYDQEYSFLMRKNTEFKSYFLILILLFSFLFVLFRYPYSIKREYLAKVVSKKQLYFVIPDNESSEIINKKMFIGKKEMSYEIVKITSQVFGTNQYDMIYFLLKQDLYYEVEATVLVQFELEKTTVGMYILKTMKGWFL